ncbi:DUF3331 domain-containing protein [Paraburkholderia phymatum]|uniref:DUF3331 domain-containing protein n=1 Tax=Paraburkholderia phymatum TaxID=148447 RepID=A0ACC6U9Z1_9BURK
MTFRNEDDIVRRALIALLAPESFASESTANAYIRKKKFRRSGPTATRTFEPVVAEPVPARVSIVEQLTSQTLSVRWSDSQSGHYADQVWRKGVARSSSFCVLTGMRIYPGDSVFRPRACESYVPANCDRMILAAVVREDSVPAVDGLTPAACAI